MPLRSFFALFRLSIPVLVLLAVHQAYGEPDLLSEVEAQRQVLAGKIQAQVEGSLADAYRQMSQNPARVGQDLKLTLDVLENAPAIDPSLRGRLRENVIAAIRQARVKRVEADQRTAETQEKMAA